MNSLFKIIVLTICLSQIFTTTDAATMDTDRLHNGNEQADEETDVIVSSGLENLVSRQKRMLFFRPLLQYKEEVVKATRLKASRHQVEPEQSDDDDSEQ